jgi:hypothetical protein
MSKAPQQSAIEEPVLWIRFVGPELSVRSLPIYELGESFIAVQRMVNKVYAVQQGRKNGRQLTHEERKASALQVVTRSKQSDAYGLASILENQMVVPLITAVLTTISQYVLKRVFDKAPEDKNRINVKGSNNQIVMGSHNQVLVGSFYNDLRKLTERVDNIGGVERIELSESVQGRSQPVVIDHRTREYVRSLAGQRLYGERRETEGRIISLHPNSLVVVIRQGPRRDIKVHLTPQHFNVVRYDAEIDDTVTVVGKPIFFFGQAKDDFDEFEGTSVRIRNTHQRRAALRVRLSNRRK